MDIAPRASRLCVKRTAPSGFTLRLVAAILTFLAMAGPTFAADWISAPAAATADSKKAPIALQFRRDLTLKAVPSRLAVTVSADQRYVLYVNGRRIAAGPSRTGAPRSPACRSARGSARSRRAAVP